MLISSSKNFIFVHITKTAGSSITKSLSQFDDRNLWLKFLNAKPLYKIQLFRDMNPLSYHATANQIKDYLGNKFDKYFSFAFVRNPFDRHASNYFFVKQNRFHPRHSKVRDFSFNEYLNWTLENNLILPQSDFITKNSDNTKIIIDFVGKFEHIDRDFRYILAEIGIDPNIHLSKSNQSKRQRDYKEYYDDESINFIRTHYKVDLDNFDYDY